MKKQVNSKLYIFSILALLGASDSLADPLAELEARHKSQSQQVYGEFSAQSNSLLEEYRQALRSGKPVDPGSFSKKLEGFRAQVNQKQMALDEKFVKERFATSEAARKERIAQLSKAEPNPNGAQALKPRIRLASQKKDSKEDEKKEETTVLYDATQFPPELEFPASGSARAPASEAALSGEEPKAQPTLPAARPKR